MIHNSDECPYTIPVSRIRPWEMNWRGVTTLMIMIKRALRSNRYARPKLHRKLTAMDKERRLRKHRRDRAAALNNPAWRGQPWVAARFPEI